MERTIRRGTALAASALALAAVPVIAAAANGETTAGPPPAALKVELQPAPMVVEELTAPKLSWQVRADGENVVQRAYQVRVARDAGGLADGGAAVWDSGRVASADSTAVPYSGPALEPGTRYRWSVRTWTAQRGAAADEPGTPSAWSPPAQFGTALREWSATPVWTEPVDNGSGWGDYTLRATVTVRAVAGGINFRARDDQNSLMWQVRGDNNRIVPHTKIGGTYATEGSFIAMPAGITLGDGQPHTLEITASGATFTTRVDGQQVDQRTIAGFSRGTIGFRNGSTETALWDDVTVTAPDTSVLYRNDFSRGTSDFGCGSASDGGLLVGRGGQCLRTGGDDWAFLRGELALADKPIAAATLYAAASSRNPARQYVYRMWVNGRLVGLGPAPATRSGDNLYAGHDVTELLRRGEANAIAAQAYTTAEKRFLAQLVVDYADGTRATFGTGDAGWRARSGAEVYPSGGSIGTNFFAAPVERLDARRFPEGFTSPGFDDNGWGDVVSKPMIAPLSGLPTQHAHEHDEAPASVTEVAPGHLRVDFGRSWIGGIRLHVPDGVDGQEIELRMGEELNPDGSVRNAMRTGNNYRDTWTLRDGDQTLQHFGYRVFRYAELTGVPAGVGAEQIRFAALSYPFEREAASFDSDDPHLNEVWEFTKRSIEALDFDVFMDSATRERGPEYGGDTYVNLMAQHALDPDRALARYSAEYTTFRPSWPTEWRYASILSAWEDWQQTGDTASLQRQYAQLRTFLPNAYLTDDGLVRKATSVSGVDDLVDWPAAERDGYVFSQYNTVINAWAYRAYVDMSQIARELGRDFDARRYALFAEGLKEAINAKLWDEERGAYRDGLANDGTPIAHWAVHATTFALAFGVADEQRAARGAQYLADRTMSCSVFCANFVLEALTNAGRADASIAMMTSDQIRSWRHMIELGAGAVMEAWDPSLKPNTSFSHPWAASPVINVAKGVFGLRPIEAGWGRFAVAPQPGTLGRASLTTPTVRGTVGASFTRSEEEGLVLELTAPANTVAVVTLPRDPGGRPLEPGEAEALYVDGRAVPTTVDGDVLRAEVGSGDHSITARRPALEPGGREPGGENPGGRVPGGEQPGGRQPGGRQPGPGAGRRAAVTQVKLAPRSLRALTRGGPTTRRGGALLSFRLSRAATVRVTFAQTTAGRRVGGTCRAGAKRGPRCTLAVRRGTVSLRGTAGLNRIRLSGRVGGRALPAGRYRVTVAAAGGASRTVGLRVLPPRR